MRFARVVVLDMETGRTLFCDEADYTGPVALACGASGAMKSAENAESQVSQSMNTDFGTVFKENQGVLSSLTSALEPIVSAGPNQKGFSPAEEAAMRTQAMDTTSAAGRQASNAVRQELASEGGGNSYLPSGSDAAINAGLAEDTAQKNAAEQLGITQADYGQGRQDFFNAEGALATAPGALENPATAAGEAAAGAASSALQGADTVNQANNAWEGELGGMIGQLGSAALTGFCVTVGTIILCWLDGRPEEVPVETLKQGDVLMGVEDMLEEISDISKAAQPCVQLKTENGLELTCSASHTILLPRGGYVRAQDAKGVKVQTQFGPSRIVAVTDAGTQPVVQIKLRGGSHTYRSNGIWSEE